MQSYKAILQYDGTDRLGFQFLADAPTIQGDLNAALATILSGEFTTRAASRTDKGVHALAQVIKITTEDMTPLTLSLLNSTLPAHMRCLDIQSCPVEFIPSMDQRTKEYCYLFSSTGERFIAVFPAQLNIIAMQECAKLLVGVHDFKNFWSIGGVSNSTTRHILECEIAKIDPRVLFQDSLFTTSLKECYHFRIVGTGFLKHMVRHLMGALWLVGTGRLSVEEFQRYLEGELKPQRPWKKADPKGLILVKVSYV